MTIAECFKMQRELKGLSQYQLAEMIAVSQPMIAQIEKGSKLPSLNIIMDTADVLNCSLDELVGRSARKEV